MKTACSLTTSELFLLDWVTAPAYTYDMGTVTVENAGYKCERCGHVWVPRGPRAENRQAKGSEAQKPRLCPKCKSAYWETPRKAPLKKRAKK